MKKLPHIKKFFKFTLKHYSMNDNIKKNNDYTIFIQIKEIYKIVSVNLNETKKAGI